MSLDPMVLCASRCTSPYIFEYMSVYILTTLIQSSWAKDFLREGKRIIQKYEIMQLF